MKTPADAIETLEASIEINAAPEVIYDMVSDVTRMGEWSSENVGADWIEGATGKPGEWFEGHNKSGEREWSRACQIACADRGQDFTFVVGGIEDNCTWWSYEMAPTATGTRLTERWWIVNKTPAVAAATQEQVEARVALTQVMLQETIAAVKVSAES